MSTNVTDDLRKKIYRAVHSATSADATDLDTVVGRVLLVVSEAHARSWPASNGNRAIYVRVGCWQEGGRIHVTIPAGRSRSDDGDVPGIHRTYGPDDREYAILRAQLERWGRWSSATTT